MDGEKKFVLVVMALVVVCLTVLYSLLFLSLWPYRQWIGMSLLVLLALGVSVWLRGRLVEQDVRLVRYRHQEETPLDPNGEPYYWHTGMQVNPHRVSQVQDPMQDQYEGYQPYGSWRDR
jgi:cell division protein FtsW (lipid II flippase)